MLAGEEYPRRPQRPAQLPAAGRQVPGAPAAELFTGPTGGETLTLGHPEGPARRVSSAREPRDPDRRRELRQLLRHREILGVRVDLAEAAALRPEDDDILTDAVAV